MKVYIQVSVLVLCSCFVQDALSAAQKTEQVESAAAAAKYSNLEKLKTAFWDNFEAINNGSENGKLVARDTRNLVGTVLGEPLFWQLATDALAKQAKYTHDKRKADVKVRLCNLVTDTLTSQGTADGLLRVADNVYETAVRANTNVVEDALQFATDAVNDGRVTNVLDAANELINDVQLEPVVVHNMFELSRKYLDTCGLFSVTNGMAKRLVSSMNRLNIKGPANAQPQRTASKGGPYERQRSVDKRFKMI